MRLVALLLVACGSPQAVVAPVELTPFRGPYAVHFWVNEYEGDCPAALGLDLTFDERGRVTNVFADMRCSTSNPPLVVDCNGGWLGRIRAEAEGAIFLRDGYPAARGSGSYEGSIFGCKRARGRFLLYKDVPQAR